MYTAIVDRAARWLGPAYASARGRTHSIARLETNGIFDWGRHPFLTCPRSSEPLAKDGVEYAVVAGALARWEQDRHSNLAFLGACGTGKSTLLRRIEATLDDLPLVHHRFASRILGETQLLQQLADSLGLPPPCNLDDLAAHLQAGAKQVILLDDCHLLFLCRPGGFAPLDRLLRLMRTTGRHILWITTWNVYSWIYLENLRSISDHLAMVHIISPRSPAEIQRMLLDVLRQINLEVTWSEDETEAIFRGIWTHARGRPTLAQHILLRSLYPAGDGQFTLHADKIYRLPQQCPVKDGEETYALGSLIRHGVLTARELASINHISEAHAAAILARTTANDLTISLEPDHRLNPIYIDAVVAYLDSRRAISFRGVGAD
ncbi:MAG: hypothetical protein ACE5LU_19160 [Anaerolineae bacterium]